jgi:hypothetical protein
MVNLTHYPFAGITPIVQSTEAFLEAGIRRSRRTRGSEAPPLGGSNAPTI